MSIKNKQCTNEHIYIHIQRENGNDNDNNSSDNNNDNNPIDCTIISLLY